MSVSVRGGDTGILQHVYHLNGDALVIYVRAAVPSHVLRYNKDKGNWGLKTRTRVYLQVLGPH